MRTKKVKPPPKSHEYKLIISKKHDDVNKKDFISFDFQTTKEFLTFTYILKIEPEILDSKLTFKILGFTAPISELSNSGHAGFEYKFYDYKYHQYDIIIDRKDSSKSKFKLLVQKQKTEPLKTSHISKDSFIDITTE